MNIQGKLAQYISFLLEYNKKINLVSRQITDEGLEQLLVETEFLNGFISEDIRTIVDAGSGNGLLGIPVALFNENLEVVLVEPKKKKSIFLQEAVEHLQLENCSVHNMSIEEYLKLNMGKKKRGVIARGFPNLAVFCRYIQKRMIREAVLITSDMKIKKNMIELESVGKKTYNVPLRENLKILKMEKAARDKQ